MVNTTVFLIDANKWIKRHLNIGVRHVVKRKDNIMVLNADLSQIEWRVAAFLSQDPTMITEINSGVDQHTASCTNLMKLPLNKLNRFYAKTFNFRINKIVLLKPCEFRENLRAIA